MKGANNRKTFIKELTEEICQKYGLSRTATKSEYYETLGAITLASYLLAPKFNEQLLPLIMTARSVSGNLLFIKFNLTLLAIYYADAVRSGLSGVN